MEPHLRHRTVELPNGTRLAVQEGGRPAGPHLLLLPGLANSHAWWSDLRGRFEDDWTTVTFDYRGTGSTHAAEDAAWSTALFAEDAVAVLDACGATTAHDYGTSMGGRVAQVLAGQAPERVERLVPACTSPGGPAAVERSQAVRLALADPDAAARRRALLALMYTPAWIDQGRTSHLLGDPSMTSRAQTLHLRVSARHDASALLGLVTAPTLVLHGDADEMAPASNALALARAIEHAEVWIHRGGRHGFFDEFAGDVTPRVRRFLAG